MRLDSGVVFATFGEQDSGCMSWGVTHAERRWFVKRATTDAAVASLRRAVRLHTSVRHPAIIRPCAVTDEGRGLTLVYEWHEGTVLNAATVRGSNRDGLARFCSLPVPEVERALVLILDAHVAIAAAGFVAVDLYDGCFLYDFTARQMRLIDLDEYRPGPFVLDADRLPGSRRFMAPEELQGGSVIDHRTTVHLLGRSLHLLLDAPTGWRGTPVQREVVDRATDPDPERRHAGPAALARAWQQACGPVS